MQMQTYELELVRQGKAAATVKSYLAVIRHFSRFVAAGTGEPFGYRSLQPAHLIAYRDHQLRCGLKLSTINQRRTALKSWGRFLVGKRLLPDNPLDFIARIKPGPEKPAALSPVLSERKRQLLAHYLAKPIRRLQDLRNYCLIEIAVSTGLKAKELMNLQIGQVLCRKGIPEALSVGTGLSSRLVPLELSSPDHLALYLALRKLQQGTMLFKGKHGPEKGLTASNIRCILKPVWSALAEPAVSQRAQAA